MISVEEALEMVLTNIKTLGVEEAPLAEALGRVLAEDVTADADVPFADNSAMDGYAVRAADVAGASEDAAVELVVLEDVPAGKRPTCAVGAGQAVRIMTGAPVPEGADAVVMVETTERAGEHVRVKAPVAAGKNIRRAGEDIRRGETLLHPGRQLRAADIGILASVGKAVLKVYRRPVVGILATGDEIVEPDKPMGPGVVRNSNSYTLFAQCEEMGASPLYFGIVRDDAKVMEKVFLEAAGASYLVLTTGGVSVGDYDLVKDVLGRLGDIRFWKVKVKPGKPMAFGALKGVPLFGLPGNPVSAAVAFETFVRPALLKMMGAAALQRPVVRAVLDEDIREKPGRMKILRGIARWSDGCLHVRTTGPQGSGMLTSIFRANCLIRLEAAQGRVAAGETVEVELLRIPEE